MPKVRSKRVAQRVRKNSVPGKNKSEQGLQGSRRTKTPDPTVIANSVFALTLSKKSGYEIEFKSSDEKLPVRIQDMIKIYKKVTGKDIILKPGLSHAEIFELVVKRLKNFLPNNYSIFLNGETEKTELIIYQACEYANWLPGFQIEPAIPKLQKHPALFDLFLQFIRSFSLYSGCEMWYNGIFEASKERLEEMVETEEGYFDSEIFEEIKTELEYYNKGLPNEIANRICSKNKLPPEMILRRLSHFKVRNEITEIIRQGCALMIDDAHIGNYDFEPYIKENFEDYYLSFVCQAVILFGGNNHLANEYDEWINSEANEGGIAEPICTLSVLPDNKPVDLEKFKVLCAWPKQLATFMSTAWDLIYKYSKKK